MLRDVWTKTLWDQRRALLGWSIGFVAVAMMYAGFFQFAATPEYQELIESMPAGLVEGFGWDDISSPAGYLGSTVYGLLGSALIAVMTIGMGAKAIAGSEEDGSLEVLITMPVTRTKVVIDRTVALLLAALGGGVAVFIGVLAVREPADIDISIGLLAAASLGLALLGLLFGAFTIMVGAFVGKRGLVIGVGAAFAVLGFLVNALAPQVEQIAWLENLSPFHWYDATGTLGDGLDWGLSLLMVAVAVTFVAIAVLAFNRRDVRGT